MKLLFWVFIIICILVIYYAFFGNRNRNKKYLSSMKQELDEAKVKSQLLKQELKESGLDAKDNLEAAIDNTNKSIIQKIDESKVQASILKQDMYEKLEDAKDDVEAKFDNVQHVLEDYVDDIKIQT